MFDIYVQTYPSSVGEALPNRLIIYVDLAFDFICIYVKL